MRGSNTYKIENSGVSCQTFYFVIFLFWFLFTFYTIFLFNLQNFSAIFNVNYIIFIKIGGASAIAFVPARRDPHPRRDRAASKCPGVEAKPGAIAPMGDFTNLIKDK